MSKIPDPIPRLAQICLVHIRGAGKTGMTVKELAAACPRFRVASARDRGDCLYVLYSHGLILRSDKETKARPVVWVPWTHAPKTSTASDTGP